jgi:hypothetical protein
MLTNNAKITICMIFVLLLTFSSLVVFEKTLGTYFEKTDVQILIEKGENHILSRDIFFQQDFSNEKTIFLIGSSHVGRINVTKINDYLSSDGSITLYNLARGSDTPVDRLADLDGIILAKPEIIFYGISYRDFSFPYLEKPTSFLPDPQLVISDLLYSIFNDIVPSNPQWLTQTMLNKIIRPDPERSENIIPSIGIPNTPFLTTSQSSNLIRTNDQILKTVTSKSEWDDPLTPYRNVRALHSFIQQIQSHEIEIILFTTPMHNYYLDSLSDNQKKNFSALLDDLRDEYGLKIYEFNEKYVGLNVWDNSDHISTHDSVMIFNNDIAKMIMMETAT